MKKPYRDWFQLLAMNYNGHPDVLQIGHCRCERCRLLVETFEMILRRFIKDNA